MKVKQSYSCTTVKEQAAWSIQNALPVHCGSLWRWWMDRSQPFPRGDLWVNAFLTRWLLHALFSKMGNWGSGRQNTIPNKSSAKTRIDLRCLHKRAEYAWLILRDVTEKQGGQVGNLGLIFTEKQHVLSSCSLYRLLHFCFTGWLVSCICSLFVS